MILTAPTLCREDQGKFPDYPSDEEGGSALIFNPESVLPCDSDGEGIKKDEKGKKEEKKEGEEEEEKGFRLPPSDFLDSIKTGEKTFNGKYIIWTDRQTVVGGMVVEVLEQNYRLSPQKWGFVFLGYF